MKKTFSINRNSKEYLPVQVSATKEGVSFNPTGDSVQIAIPKTNVQPVSGDWKSASWDSYDGEYFARILVGPGGDIVPLPGTYDIYVKVTDSPEVPALYAGKLIIT